MNLIHRVVFDLLLTLSVNLSHHVVFNVLINSFFFYGANMNYGRILFLEQQHFILLSTLYSAKLKVINETCI